MDLLNQCKIWLQQHNFVSVVENLECMPQIARSKELDLILAEAYLGLAKSWQDRPLFRKATVRLLAHEKEMTEDFWWNVRVAQTFFNTSQFGYALRHYQKAHSLQPNNCQVEAALKESKQLLTNPVFYESFAKRVDRAWIAFEALEGRLRSAIRGDINIVKAREAFGKIDDTLEIAFDALGFSVAGGSGKAELILSPQSNWCRFYELSYFKDRAPASVLKNWDVIVGRQPTKRMRIGIKDLDISARDVKVWFNSDFNGDFQLSVYCKKLAPLLSEENDRYFWEMTDLIDNSIGELPRMRYFNTFEVLSKPLDLPYLKLPQLATFMKEFGLDLSLDPATYEKNFTFYMAPPMKDILDGKIKNHLRGDIFAGTTNCAQLLGNYSHGVNNFADDLMTDGAVPGFIFFVPPYGTDQEKNLQMLQELQDFMTTKFSPPTLLITGTAKGLVFWYVDFIAWSIAGALEAAEIFFQKEPKPPICGFQILHTEAEPVFWEGEDKVDKVGTISRIMR